MKNFRKFITHSIKNTEFLSLENILTILTENHVLVEELHVEQKNIEIGILKIQVIDSGIGISNTQKEKLFRPFIQAEDSTSQ